MSEDFFISKFNYWLSFRDYVVLRRFLFIWRPFPQKMWTDCNWICYANSVQLLFYFVVMQ